MITQEDIMAAKLHLQGIGPWKLSEIAIGEDDALVKTLSAYRIAAEKAVLDRFDEDWLADIIQDSFEMDWTARDGARAIIRSIGLKT